LNDFVYIDWITMYIQLTLSDINANEALIIKIFIHVTHPCKFSHV